MPNQEMVQIIAKGLRDGLPHPGNRKQHQTAQLIRMPGINPQGVPRAVLDHMAKEAGLPSSDMPTLVAEALVNLIETDGNSEIINKSELEALRAVLKGLQENVNGDDQVNSGTNAGGLVSQRPMDGSTPRIRHQGPV